MCRLVAMPQPVAIRILCTLDRGSDLRRLREVARAFALPQLCFPASQPLVAHAGAEAARAEREAMLRAAVPVEISGATGGSALVINGVYKRTAEMTSPRWRIERIRFMR